MLSIIRKKRLFNQLIFDEEFYKQQNEDLELTGKSSKQIRKHFIKKGLIEGRCASPVFDAKYYVKNNNDVSSLVNNDYKKAVDHFLSHGVHENRRSSPGFDINFYYNNNKDLQTGIGRDYLSLYQHFIVHGKDERRSHNPNLLPDSFMIELTNRCNLRCVTCPREYEYGREMDIGSMDYNNLIKLLDEMLPLAKSINLTGLGETFIYKLLPEVTEYISRNEGDKTTFLSTNAQTPNCLSMLNDIKGNITVVQISMDGIGEVYENVRNGANFDTFSNNVRSMVRILEDTSTSLMFNMVAFGDNYHTIPNVVDFAKDLGVPHVHVNSRNLVTMPSIDIKEYDLYRSKEFLDTITRAKELAHESGIHFTAFDNSGYCELVYNHFYITWDGFLVPCCAKPFPKELNFGNVFQDSLYECITKYQRSEFRRNWDNMAVPEFCNRCHVVH